MPEDEDEHEHEHEGDGIRWNGSGRGWGGSGVLGVSLGAVLVFALLIALAGMAFVYPTSAELREVEQVKLPRLLEGRVGFDIIPTVDVDAHLLEWEQEDNYTGLQQVRGLGGPFNRVKRVGVNRYSMAPGVYGEFMDLDELELTTRRQLGTFERPVDVTDLVARRQEQLLVRRLDRIEFIIWTLLATGTYSISGDAGVLHTDTYSLQTYAAGVAWGTVATATPIADFRAVQLLSRGKGVSFGAQAKAYMNRVTFNNLMGNTNANDLGGRFNFAAGSIRSGQALENILAGEDLPMPVPYDEGYLDDAGTFQPFIPNSKAIVVGRRQSGAVIADYAMTRNANNPGMAQGAYTEVIEQQEPPKRINVFDGHNGGIRFYFPSGVVIMSV